MRRDPFKSSYIAPMLSITDSNGMYSVSFVRVLELKKPIFGKTACYGHFGWSGRPWETPKELDY